MSYVMQDDATSLLMNQSMLSLITVKQETLHTRLSKTYDEIQEELMLSQQMIHGNFPSPRTLRCEMGFV